MTTYLLWALKLAGIFQLVLCIASWWIPQILDWKGQMKSWTVLMRQLFMTYALYILGSHLCFSFISWFAADYLLEPQPASFVVSQLLLGFIGLWWTVRLLMQFVGFDLSQVAKTRFNVLAKHLLSLLFVYLVMVYWGIFIWNFYTV